MMLPKPPPSRKIWRDPTEIFSRSVQPILWLMIFGQVFARTHAIPTGGLDDLAFMTAGFLAQSVLFTGIFYGIAIISGRSTLSVRSALSADGPWAVVPVLQSSWSEVP